jgi:voltage-gated potassium channel Kch
MQAGSFGIVATFAGILALSIVLAITLVAPIIAVGIFVVAFGAFLLWRAQRRTEEAVGARYGARVPSTEEAAADPVADSGAADVARSRSDARTRHRHA